MFWIARDILLGVHILLAIIWVGGILFVGWGVFPAVNVLKHSNQQQFLLALMNWTHRLFLLAGIGVIATGILLGTVFGPVRDLQSLLFTTYGHRFFLAFLMGLLTLAWGTFISYPFSMKVLSNSVLWEMAEGGYDGFLKSSMRSVTIISGVEVLGFILLLVMMMSF